MNRYVTLLRREFWEHRGGFLWAPVWASGILLLLMALALATAMWHASGRFNGTLHIGVPVQLLLQKVPDAQLTTLGFGLNAALGGFSAILQITLFFVVFFYLIGALYDDRKDRSILFWKSLPVSDAETVLAKVVTATWLAPLISFAATVVLGITFLCLLSVFVWANGGDPLRLVWGPAEPASLYLRFLMAIPVNFVWSLPAVGWLLLASSFARSKPFLWAVALPAVVGVFIGWFQVLTALQLPSSWYWQHVFTRFVIGLGVGSWYWVRGGAPVETQAVNDIAQGLARRQGGHQGNLSQQLLDIVSNQLWNVLTTPETWIGAGIGVLMILGAIYFRRRRELAD